MGLLHTTISSFPRFPTIWVGAVVVWVRHEDNGTLVVRHSSSSFPHLPVRCDLSFYSCSAVCTISVSVRSIWCRLLSVSFSSTGFTCW